MVLHTLITDLLLHGCTWGFKKIQRYKTKMAFVKFLAESTNILYFGRKVQIKKKRDATVDVYAETASK